jgi:hypothetical protein
LPDVPWKYLAALAYACYLTQGRGAIMLDARPSRANTTYAPQARHFNPSDFDALVQKAIEAYSPETEIVCVLSSAPMSSGYDTTDMSVERHSLDLSTPVQSYYEALRAARMAGKEFIPTELAGHLKCTLNRLHGLHEAGPRGAASAHA